MDTYYVRASAFARLNDYPKARATLLEATRKDPGEFVTWGLLGDLAVRRGELRQARSAYRRASSLNPRDPALRAAAQDPRRVGGSD
jgi:Flp pilus assembly protein TadD